MKMMMMKLFCMRGRGLCYKHSLGSPLMQPLPPSVCNLQTLHGFSKLRFGLQRVCSFSSANPPCCTEWSGYSFYQLDIEKTAVRNCWGVKSLCVKLLPHAVRPSAPIQASRHGPATVTLSRTTISPNCRVGCKCRRTSEAGAECLGLSAQVLCSGTQSVECSSLDRDLPCDQMSPHSYPQSEHRHRVTTGTLTWSQVLSAVLCESFCGERKSPLPLATRHLWQALRGDEEIWWGWQKILRADLNSEWNQEYLAHLLIYFEEHSKCQFSSGFM